MHRRGRTWTLGLIAVLASCHMAAASDEANGMFEFQEVEDFSELASFENVEAFEEHVASYQQACFDAWAGSSRMRNVKYVASTIRNVCS